MSCGDQLDPRRVYGIVWGTAEQEEEEAALVRRVKRACDQRMDLIEERSMGEKTDLDEETSLRQIVAIIMWQH